MSVLLKQSTQVVISFGPFVDITDGNTYEVGLAGTGANQLENTTTGIRISKNGGALAARAATAVASTYDALGMYLVTLQTGDVNTVGVLRVAFNNATALTVWQDFMILPANVYDSLMGTDLLQIDATQLLGTAWLAPGVAGTPDVNAKLIGGTSQTGNDAGADLNAIVAKLPTNYLMGSSVLTDKDDEIDAIKVMTDKVGTVTNTGGTATIGAILGDMANSPVVTRLTNINTKTTNLPADPASATGAVGSVTGAVGSVAGNVDGNVTGSVGSLAAQAKLDVNAEVVDVINTDTSTELGAPPVAASSLRARIGWLFALARNKITQTSTTQLLKADDGTTTIGTSTVSDDGTTATRGEFA